MGHGSLIYRNVTAGCNFGLFNGDVFLSFCQTLKGTSSCRSKSVTPIDGPFGPEKLIADP
jgi:hypothetical protein